MDSWLDRLILATMAVLAIGVDAAVAAEVAVDLELPVVAGLPIEVSGDSAIWMMTAMEQTGIQRRRIDSESADSVIVSELGSRRFFSCAGDSVLETGFENRSIALRYTNPIAIMRTPLALNDSLAGDYSAKGRYYGTTEVGVAGNYYTIVDGRGSIVTEDVRLDDVVRVHHHREGLQLLTDNAAIAASFLVSGASAIDTSKSTGTITRVEHDFLWWFAKGADYPVAEAVIYVSIDAEGRRLPVTDYCLLNLPGVSGCQEEKTEQTEIENDRDQTKSLLEEIVATMSADNTSVTVTFTAVGGSESREYVFGIFDPAGRQLGELIKTIETEGPTRLTIPLTTLPSGQLLLSIMDEDGRSQTFKVNRE